MKKKLISKKGESILETLVALIVIVFSIVFLTQAILTANRVNAYVKAENTGFTYNNKKYIGTVVITEQNPSDGQSQSKVLSTDHDIRFKVYSVKYYKKSENGSYVDDLSRPKYFLLER